MSEARMRDMGEANEMQAWISTEQVRLWGEFLDQLRDSVSGRWSMGASNVGVRILGAARLVGPTEPEDLPWQMFAGGVADALYALIDIELAQPADAEWRRLSALMEQHGGTREACRSLWAPTVVEIQKDAEWLRQDEAP